ncbi:MAG: FHA domain-containing protein [Planctomycetes bacterium]|nr:FHA domain-containing protein [Planctomycetota bacterium]
MQDAALISYEEAMAWPLSQGANVVGRDSACDLKLLDQRGLSRRHCLIFWEEGEASVSDLGSMNGTLLNGRLLYGWRPLQHGDVLTLGARRFVFRMHAVPHGLRGPDAIAMAVNNPISLDPGLLDCLNVA